MKITRVENYSSLGMNNKAPSFGRIWEEHVSWGANYIANKGKTNFKLFSFPDAKAVLLELTQKASVKMTKMWERFVDIKKPEMLAAASTATAIAAISTVDSNSKLIPMENKGDGVFELKGVNAKPGDGYRFIVVHKDGHVTAAKDPYAKKQEGIHSWSTVYNSNNYKWQNTDWLEGKDPRRIVRKPNEILRGLENLKIEEINIPTLSKEGTFDKAKATVDEISKKNDVTAIEIMPVENTYSLQWGYDGVDKFAVNEKLGGAKGLKEFVDYAHGKGLNVIIDIVPNHIGTDGNYLSKIGPYIKGPGKHGDLFNFEGQNNRYVRDWMVNAALWAADEYKVDGIRFDLTGATGSDWLLREIVLELNEHKPDVFLIAEDHRKYESVTNRFVDNKNSHEAQINHIDYQVNIIANGWGHSGPGEIGFDSEWDTAYREALTKLIMEPNPSTLDSIDIVLPKSLFKLHYAHSHDEIGNLDGTRFISKYMSHCLELHNKVDNNYSESRKGQIAAQAAQKLTELLVSDKFLTIAPRDLKKFENELGINTYISKERLNDAFNTAVAKQRLLLGTVYTTPGPKMFFQGDDAADLSHFKFFREFSDEKEIRQKNLNFANDKIDEKGYDTLEELARPDSMLGRVKPKGIHGNVQEQMKEFMFDLNKIIEENPALKNGKITSMFKDNNHLVHMHRLVSGDNDIFVIKNYGQGFHFKKYSTLGFPENSTWEEIFSSDDEKYGGLDYTNESRRNITNLNQNLSLAPNSFIILRRIK